jgi:MFS transporter, ACS family, tartrate transporter
MDDALARLVTRKLTVRLVYFAGLLFFLNYLDRVNVGFAALRMNQDLGFTASVYGFGAGVFFVSYALLEIPSNLILRRVGPRLWLARIMVTWGIISGCFAFIQGSTGFYVLRFLLGAAEAGFVPGIVLYLTFWFPAAYRARAFATFFAASQLSSIIGAPLSGWILSSAHGLGGLSGWRWMFLLEAVPSVIAGIVILFYLPDRPEQARWLMPNEKAWLREKLAADVPSSAHRSVGAFLADIRVWTLTGIYFFYAVSVYGILFWLPQIIRSLGNLDPVEVGFLTSIPYICALISMLVVGRHSDRTGERRLHIAGCALLGGVALIASAYVGHPTWAYVLICVAAIGIWGQNGVFWTLPTSYLSGAAAAGGIAFINCVAQFGGFFGPFGVGWIKDATGTFTLALLPLAAASLLVVLLALSLGRGQPTDAVVPMEAAQ